MQEFVLLGLVMILGLGAYWSLVIFPRQRDFSKRQQYIRQVQSGDQMITYGGIIATVRHIDADQGVAEVEIANGVVVKMLLAALVRPYDPEELAESVQRANALTTRQHPDTPQAEAQ